MGCTIVILSPRLSYQVIVKLLRETGCECLVYFNSAPLLPVIDQVKASNTVKTLAMMQRGEYDRVDGSSLVFSKDVNPQVEKKRYACILHSSGSTGLPKPL